MNGGRYIAYRCKTCGLIFIIPYDEKEKIKGEHIQCPLRHMDVEELDKYENMLECMNQKYSRLI